MREQGRGSRRGKEAEKRKEGKEREGPDLGRGEGGEGRGEHGGRGGQQVAGHELIIASVFNIFNEIIFVIVICFSLQKIDSV